MLVRTRPDKGLPGGMTEVPNTNAMRKVIAHALEDEDGHA